MNKIRKHLFLLLSAIVGFVLFWVFQYAPTLSGENAEATKHAVNRDAAEAAAVSFVQERVGADAVLHGFAMYAAERNAFGYLYKEGIVQEAMDQLRDALPLEAYRVEVKEEASGRVHLVDINPYTGKPAEWVLDLQGGTLSSTELERAGRETLASLFGSAANVEATRVGLDAASGEVSYDLRHPALGGLSAQLIVRADRSGTNEVYVTWSVPEAYVSLAERQEHWASLLGTAGLALSAALQLGAVIYVLGHLKQVRYSRGAFMAFVFALFYCAININMYPGLKATVLGILNGEAYVPAGGESADLIAGVISVLLVTNVMTLCLAIGMYFSAVAGDRLLPSLSSASWPSWKDREYGDHLASSVWKGYLFAFVMLGLQSVIYLGAESGFRTWYTIDALTSSNNMMVPLLLPLLAWCAALSEEAVYRLFALTALKKLLRFTFPAVLLSSMIWAMGHVTYPVYPFYTRFVEVTLIGLAFSYIFLKHGFLTAVYAHATVDIIWMGISITSNAPTVVNWTSFAVYLAVPAVIAVAVQQLHRRWRPAA